MLGIETELLVLHDQDFALATIALSAQVDLARQQIGDKLAISP